jgi:hypothetical protein
MSKSVASPVSFASLASAIGKALGELKGLETKAAAFKEAINLKIAELHKGKVKVGTYKKDGTGCAIATAFVDGCVEGGLSQSTAQKTYLPTFKKAVADGKPVGDWNGQRAKKGGKGKGGKASEPKSLANKLATCYRDEDFAGFVADLQAAFENDEGDLIELVKSYLEAAGIELKDAE